MSRFAAGVVCALGLAAVGWAEQVPRKSPDLAIHLSNGKDVRVSQYHGKIVALVFIITT